ncbi:hypothetical protein Y5W_03083 [Alcanivorax sp. 521-1]|uniref:DUF3617 family protein n=1 Tax=Alloalcanivorax profundimaris TaxID=2735259 RepID=A0ABS0AV12_9GAMM|nr:hypothetical protein [Alloalcanivorax profundimaris]MBF5057789.1 hypothetical protein [Alloalcanivorax profundimaris]
MQKNALIAIAALPLLATTAIADELYPLKADGTAWSQVAKAEKRDKLSVAALSTDGEMEMVFTFQKIIGMEQFLGIFDHPAKECGQDGQAMTMNVPTENWRMEVNGQAFPSAANCREGRMQYTFTGVDAGHDITSALLEGESVTLSLPREGGRQEYTWEADGFKALAGERVKAYENSARYKAYAGQTR